MSNRIVFLAIAWSVAAYAAGEDQPSTLVADTVASPLSPADSLEHFVLLPDLQIELAAAEPEVVDPVEVRFDEHGRLWVVEMRDYPSGPISGQEPQSRIRVLEDRDGDGRFETATTFVEQLVFPTGLQPWRGGVFVTLAGEIVYLADRDGDGTADERERWYSGFTQENQQLRANHPRLGIDGWIYVAGGLRGGSISNHRVAGAEPIDIKGRDFRFDPLTGAAEAVAGNSQFTLALNAFGDRFVVDNRHPLRQVMIEERYLQRAPYVAFPALVEDVMKAGEESTVHPLAPAWTTSNLHAGQFTAACGSIIYDESALGKRYQGIGIACEPTGSLVHAERLLATGATYHGEPLAENQEFLASPDPWFRPVNLEIAPDGSLLVVDMYRAVIEHPQWMPEELKQRKDLRDGDDRGRIYRVAAPGSKASVPKTSMATFETAELVAALDSDNHWRRTTAFRLLLQGGNGGKYQFQLLGNVIRQGRSPAGRVAALWLLERLGHLELPDVANYVVVTALRDGDPRVQAQGVRLAELLLADSEEPFAAELNRLALVAKPDARLDFHLALALGAVERAESTDEALSAIAFRGHADNWIRHAVSLAAAERAAQVLMLCSQRVGSIDAALVHSKSDGDFGKLFEELGTSVGAQLDADGAATAIVSLGDQKNAFSAWVFPKMLLGLGEGAARRGQSLVRLLAQAQSADRPRAEKQLNLCFRQTGQ
ncbi:MAG: hypothetical protein KDA42_06170, partial [Planctomycetales bacterium]|nr:hypothetical protein [Planctomycetales bacterium]